MDTENFWRWFVVLVTVAVLCLGGLILYRIPARLELQPPPQFTETKFDGCSYLTWKDSGKWEFLHKASCTNDVHSPKIHIQMLQLPKTGGPTTTLP